MPENKNDRSRQNQGQQGGGQRTGGGLNKPSSQPQKQDPNVPRPGEDKGDRNKMGQRQGEGKNLDDPDQDQDIDQGELPDEDKVTQRRPAMPGSDKDRR